MHYKLKKVLLASFSLFVLSGTHLLADTTLLPAGAVWKYLDTGVDLGTTWRPLSYNDSSWASGPAELGYGDGDEATLVGFGGNTSAKFTTTYFRRTMLVTNAAGLGSLTLTLTYDDGAAVYINGSEVYRINLPAGQILSSTFASGAADYTPVIATIPATFLVEGTNIVAVEMHQSDLTSSDVSFNLSITANLAPTVAITTPANNAVISGPTNINLTANASDPDGTIARVDYYQDLTQLGTATATPFTAVWSNVTEGAYSIFAVATDNTGGASTSAPVNITVVDLNPPTLFGALGTTNTVLVTFSKKVSQATALNTNNYTINNGVTVSGAAYGSSSNIVVLQVSGIAEGQTYTLTVNNVQDFNGNAILPNSQTTFSLATFIPADIGNPAIGGTLVPVAGGFNLTAAGTNISGTLDQFSFAYQQVSGDFDFKVRLQGFNAADPWAKGGLMARETLTSNSRFAASMAGPSIAGAFFTSRSAIGTASTTAGAFPVNYPYTWLRLQRVGNVFNGYASLDGQNWSPLGSVTIAMPTGIFIGFAATSANASQTATVQFRDFQSAAGGTVAPVVLTREPLGPSSRRTGLVISEIMYHPKSRPDGKQTEFIEIYNSMSMYEDISGYRLSGDVDYTFAPGTIIQPGKFLVLGKIKSDVESAYGISGVLEYGITNGFNTNVVGNVTNVTPNIDNALSNGGGTLKLHNKAGAVLLDASFSTKYPWPIEADGGGHSLVLARPSYGEGSRLAWAASDVIGGSPGNFDAIGSDPARNVVINEFLAHTDPPQEDMIELFNHGNSSVDISGFWLSDTVNTNKFRIPNGTVLAPRGFISFSASTNPGPLNLGFALTASGEQIVLVNSNQTRVIEAIGFDGQENGVSMGRYPDGAPTLRRLSAVTAGTTNAPPLESPIVINEIMFSPISGNSDDEFIELYNRSASPVNIGNWGFTDGIDYKFPANTTMAPGAYLVVAKNMTRLKSHYNNLNSGNLLGNYDGTLANGGETIALSAPDYEVSTNGSGQVITNVSFRFVVNEVTYNKGGKWGYWADGGGSSLELIDPQSDNRQPQNWADSDDSAKSSWTSFEFTGNVDNAQTGQGDGNSLQLMLLGVGEAMIDDVEVRNSANVNVLNNGNFENGLASWVPQGSHDRSFIDGTGGFTGQGLHLMAGSRGDNGANRIRNTLNPSVPNGSGASAMRAKARWLRGFPEVLLRLRGGGLEAFGRLPVPTNLGTPGARNSRAVTNAGPAIFDVTHNPPLPAASQAIVVTARATDPNTVTQLVVKYRIEPATTFTSVTMKDDGTAGDAVAGDGLFSATIPGQASGARAAFFVQATDGTGVTNLFPAFALTRTFPSDAPSHECVVRWGEVEMPGSFASYHLWTTDATMNRWVNRPERLNNSPLDGTFVYNNYRVIYNMQPQYGGSPWHVGSMTGPANGPTGNRVDSVANFPEDDLLLGVTDFVLNTVGNPSGNTSSDPTGLIEQTSYEIFKAIGIHYNYRRYIHFFVNGDQRSVTGNLPGNFIMEDSQQPNGDVVKEWNPDDADGQLYKIEDWFEFPDDGGNSGTHSNDDADLQRRSTPLGGNPTAVKLSPYRFMWRKRSVSAADSANNYTNILTVVDIVSPASNPSISPLTDTMVKQFSQVVDVEQWMRIFAVQKSIGNWDSYGYERGKNCYTYRPNFGKFQLMTWDIDFTLGIGGNGTSQSIFDISDQRIAALCNTPETVRAYYRAFQDIINGPLNNSYLDPLIDARSAAFRANNVSYDPNSINTVKSYIAGRRTYLLAQLPTAAFSVAATTFTTSSNIVTITGTAPIDVKFIKIDGINYAITWTGSQTAPTSWSLRLPMNVTGNNSFTLTAYDRLGNLIAGTSRVLSINYTGAIETPENNLVFNEIMYNPLVPGAEYVELFNRSTNFTFDISGWRINGLGYTFPEGATIGPRAFLVLTKDRIAFGNAYGGSVQAYDQFTGELQHDGETLALIKPGATPAQDAIIDRVRYDGALPWPAAANGTGSSLQLLDPLQENARVGNWYSRYVPPVYSEAVSTPAQTIEGWRFVTATGSVGSGAGSQQMRLLMYLDEANGASAVLDDIAIVAGTEAEVGNNYVHNGDFESAPLLEVPALTNSWVIGTNYTNSAIIGGLVHGGSGALQMVCSTFGNAVGRVISQNLSPAPLTNGIHTLSFWFWSTNSATNFNIRLQNSSALSLKTNINIYTIPSNYIPPLVVSPATNTLSPGAANAPAVTLPAFAPLWINEVQADNLTGPLDNTGQHEPWLELYNTSTNPVPLEGLYLAPTYTNLTQWAFPAGSSIGPTQFLVIFCDGQAAQTSGGEYHTSFRLKSGSGSIALSRIYSNAPQVLDYINYASLPADRSYGSYPDGQPFDRMEFFYVTAGLTNNGRSAPLEVFINEWMASNTNYLADPADNDYDDWFELYNPGTNAVDIAGYYLTDTLTDKFKYKIPTGAAHIIPPQGFLLVWADNETGQNSSGGVPRSDLHVNFQLAGGGESIGLFAEDGTQIDAVTFGPQTGDVSEGRYPNGQATIYTMTNPTPRLPNYIPGAGNTAPYLIPIGSQSVFVNQTLAFIAGAFDPDPGQMLTFSLDAGAPPNAFIEPNTGAFAWTPTSTGTYVVPIRVTDNGTPALDDYENVVVHVSNLPSFTGPTLSGNDLTLSWLGAAGLTYQVQYKDVLSDLVEWGNFGQPLTLEADAILSISDDVRNSEHRFFRVIVLP